MVATDADAGARPDAGSTKPDCIAVPVGESVRLTGALTEASPDWLRIDVPMTCPASRLSATRVAKAVYALCPEPSPRTVTVVMRGADMLTEPAPVLEDPLLVVYRDASDLDARPFECLAASDDGQFDAGVLNSALIEGLELAAGQRVVLVATSHQAPAQRGLGHFELELSAD